ncbi:hypothetical protein TNCV_477021 [Trichonephila clavipes]|nr:hypothetical protein TNCV_477021 [Trichonephila clavipes]
MGWRLASRAICPATDSDSSPLFKPQHISDRGRRISLDPMLPATLIEIVLRKNLLVQEVLAIFQLPSDNDSAASKNSDADGEDNVQNFAQGGIFQI